MFLLETVLIVGTSPSSSAGFEKITFMVVPFRRPVPVFGFGLSKKFLENGRKEKKRKRDLVEVVVGGVKIVESEKTADIKKKSSRFFYTRTK